MPGWVLSLFSLVSSSPSFPRLCLSAISPCTPIHPHFLSLAGNRSADAITRPPHLPLAFAHKLTWDTSSSTLLASLPPGTTTWSPRPPLSTPNASHSSVTTLQPFPSAWQTISSKLEASHPCGRPRTLQDRERGKRACRKGKGGKGR